MTTTEDPLLAVVDKFLTDTKVLADLLVEVEALLTETDLPAMRMVVHLLRLRILSVLPVMPQLFPFLDCRSTVAKTSLSRLRGCNI